jgi:uncharacterized membrane protein YgaE (UPF0421/DUF939 family)
MSRGKLGYHFGSLSAFTWIIIFPPPDLENGEYRKNNQKRTLKIILRSLAAYASGAGLSVFP